MKSQKSNDLDAAFQEQGAFQEAGRLRGNDGEDDPKDRTKWLWLGAIGVVAVMVIALWAANLQSGDMTRVRVKHILIKFNQGDPVDRSRALDTIQSLRKQIEDGASFSRLAKDYSNDESSSARGGDLGYNPRGVFEAPFEAYVWSAPLGQLSDIIQTKFGFHLISSLTGTSRRQTSTKWTLKRKRPMANRRFPNPPVVSRFLQDRPRRLNEGGKVVCAA